MELYAINYTFDPAQIDLDIEYIKGCALLDFEIRTRKQNCRAAITHYPSTKAIVVTGPDTNPAEITAQVQPGSYYIHRNQPN